jgi:predicted DNA-binding transcriptional regulator YafY
MSITEGNKRFPLSQMAMSPPIQEHPPRNNQSKKLKTLFILNQTDETIFRNRFQVTLPKWALEDVDLFRWIIGFGDQVKVIHPPELVNKIRKIATQLTHLNHQ